MAIYENIYSFKVLDKIKEGEKVFGLNRESRRVFCVNDLPTHVALKYTSAENKNNQYEFWVEKEVEEKEETED